MYRACAFVLFIFLLGIVLCPESNPPLLSSQSLSLIEEGFIANYLKNNFKNVGSVPLAIKQRTLLKFRELGEKLSALSAIIRDKGVSYTHDHPLFEVCRSHLNYLMGEATDEDLKSRIKLLLERMNALIDDPKDTSIELGEPMNQLIELLDIFVKGTDFRDAELLMSSIREMKEIRAKLHKHFKLNPTELNTIEAKLNILDDLCDFASEIKNKDLNEILKVLREVKWYFEDSSPVNKYIDEKTRFAVSLEDLVGELQKLPKKALNEDLKTSLKVEFILLSGTLRRSNYRFKARNPDRVISSLVTEVTYHLRGMDRPRLFMEIYEAYKKVERSIKPDKYGGEQSELHMKLKVRELNDVIIVFIFYLLGFRGRPEAFKAIYVNNKDNVDGLVASTIEFLNIPPSEYDDLVSFTNLDMVPGIEEVISTLDKTITDLFKERVSLHRQVLLGLESNASTHLKIKVIRQSFRVIYSREIFEYWNRETATLHSIDDHDYIAMAELYNRVKLIEAGIGGIEGTEGTEGTEGISLNEGLHDTQKFKGLLRMILDYLKLCTKGAISLKDRELDLISFYHRYIFSEFNRPIDQIRENIDFLIMNIKSYLKGEEYIGSTFVGENVVSLPEQWSIITSFLQALKNCFDGIIAFPGIKLLPLEQRLYDLSSLLYFEVLDHKYSDQIQTVFLELLMILENWKIVVDYRKNFDPFDVLNHGKIVKGTKE